LPRFRGLVSIVYVQTTEKVFFLVLSYLPSGKSRKYHFLTKQVNMNRAKTPRMMLTMLKQEKETSDSTGSAAA
jgi:hypothetical protein